MTNPFSPTMMKKLGSGRMVFRALAESLVRPACTHTLMFENPNNSYRVLSTSVNWQKKMGFIYKRHLEDQVSRTKSI